MNNILLKKESLHLDLNNQHLLCDQLFLNSFILCQKLSENIKMIKNQFVDDFPYPELLTDKELKFPVSVTNYEPKIYSLLSIVNSEYPFGFQI